MFLFGIYQRHQRHGKGTEDKVDQVGGGVGDEGKDLSLGLCNTVKDQGFNDHKMPGPDAPLDRGKHSQSTHQKGDHAGLKRKMGCGFIRQKDNIQHEKPHEKYEDGMT
jgi:hypothetical protein